MYSATARMSSTITHVHEKNFKNFSRVLWSLPLKKVLSSFHLSLHFVGDGPQVQFVVAALGTADRDCLVRFPIPHREAVRHDPRADLQLLPQVGANQHVEVIAHIEENNSRRREIANIQRVSEANLDLAVETGFFDVGAGFGDA